MLRNYCVIASLLLSTFAFAQNVTIPDPVFKNYLVTEYDLNGDGEIQVSEAELIEAVNIVNGSGITDLTGLEQTHVSSLNLYGIEVTNFNVSGFQYLQGINLGDSSCVTVDASDCPLLSYFEMYNCNAVTTVDLSNTAVTYPGFRGPNVQSVDLSGCTSLLTFVSGGPELQHFDLTGCLALTDFLCTECSFESFDFSAFPNLHWIEVQDGALTSLILGEKPSIGRLDCSNNQLTSLDLSQISYVNEVYAPNNQITYLNMKNGSYDAIQGFAGNPLVYVCADEWDFLLALEQEITTPLVVNSYCDFIPGGLFDSVSGRVGFDLDNDGCDDLDPVWKSAKIHVTGTAEGDVFSDDSGHYNSYLYAGNYTVSPVLENPSYFTVSPPSVVVDFPANDSSQVIQDFCITANGSHPDLEVTVMPLTPLAPGFDADYQIVYRNKGTQVLSGNLVFGYDEPHLDFVSAQPATTSSNAGVLVWDYVNLSPFEVRTVSVVLNANSPMEVPPVNINENYGFSISGSIVADENPTDNHFVLTQTVVGSFDPNDKTCLEGSVVSPERIGEYLHYLIRFENTGTANAHNIVVKDVIDNTQFDVSTLQVLETSHAVDARISGNKAEFIFEGIELVPEGDGHVLFKIKTLNSLAVGTTVSNKADIFFDYNFPIQTNDAETTFQLLGVKDLASDASIAVYPNPASGIFSVKGSSDISSVQVYDAQGRLLQTVIGHSNEVAIDISSKARGIYFVKAFSDNGANVIKVIKE